jgi:pimeloyl-ACP methyl ester carboxylesterase
MNVRFIFEHTPVAPTAETVPMKTLAKMYELARLRAANVAFLRRPARSASAPALVLLHGIGSNAESFGALMQALSASIDVIAWNAPGYGESDALTITSPRPRDYAAVLEQLLDALHLRAVVLAGHSIGALFAASFSAAYPDRVSALALISPALGYRVKSGDPLPPPVQKRIDEIRKIGPVAFGAKRAPRLVYDPEHRPQVVAAVEKAMSLVDVEGYIQAAHALGAGDLLADAARVYAPALVAVGAQDVVTPPQNARRAHQALSGACIYREIEAAGHAVPQELPQTVANLVGEFVERNAHA